MFKESYLIEAASAFCADCGRFSCSGKHSNCPNCICGRCLGACKCECYCGFSSEKSIDEQLKDFDFNDFAIWNACILEPDIF